MYEMRQEKMSRFIRQHEMVTIKQLQELFPQVSLMTIHRDLDALAAAGLVTKVRGGARASRHDREPAFNAREKENQGGKTLVAVKAATLIQHKSCVFLDSGTTSLMLAGVLPDLPLSVVTTGPNIALALARNPVPEVTLCPGNLNKENLTVSGHSTLQFLEGINIDIAFIGASGYDNTAGFTCGKESEMLVKRQVIRQARTTAVLCDQTKFQRFMPYTFARLGDIKYVISDITPPDDFLAGAQKSGTSVLYYPADQRPRL